MRLPDGAEVVVVDSGETRSLSGVPYAERRDETVAAAALLGGTGAPRTATRAEVEAITEPVLRRRARHLVTENERVRGVCEAFARGDLAGAGALMTESHASLRDDQEVTTTRLDELVERLVATPGVHGARLTGGGWGGCVVALSDARRPRRPGPARPRRGRGDRVAVGVDRPRQDGAAVAPGADDPGIGRKALPTLLQ